MQRLAVFFASGFGSGFMPVAPGTWGSLVGTLVFLLFWINGWTPNLIEFGLLLVITTIIGHLSIKNLPDDWKHDDGRIVIDEVLGIFVTMFYIPLGWGTLIAGLVIFRIFDIWKPLGIRRMDRLNSDFSVLADDILAGVYSNITLHLLMLLLSSYDFK